MSGSSSARYPRPIGQPETSPWPSARSAADSQRHTPQGDVASWPWRTNTGEIAMSTEILNFINGEYVKNVDGKTFEKRTPVDNSLVGLVYEAGRPEVDAA